MKKTFLVIIAAVILGGCNLIPQKSGVEIMSYPPAKVFIDGKEAGMTPYKNKNLKPGETEIKLSTEEREWKKRVKLVNNASTVIDWEFGKKEEEESGGYILYMEKTGDKQKAGLMVNAVPDKSSVKMDGEVKGLTPMRMDDIGESDKQVTIFFPGHKTINVFVKPVAGWQLIIDAKLMKEELVKLREKSLEAEIKQAEEETKEKVVIKETETGWLRVREASSSGSREIGKVKPGEKYILLEEAEGWYLIEIDNETKGWVSARYVDKLL